MTDDTGFILVQNADTSVVVVPTERVVSAVVQEQNVVSATVQEQSVVSLDAKTSVAVESVDVHVVAQGQQGVPGPPGLNSDTVIAYLAAAAVSAFRVVVVDAGGAVHASNDMLSHAQRVVGLTAAAALQGASVTVVRNRELQNPAWSLVAGAPVYLGTDGTLIQSAAVSPALFSLCIGFATAADKVFVSIGQPIGLAQP